MSELGNWIISSYLYFWSSPLFKSRDKILRVKTVLFITALQVFSTQSWGIMIAFSPDRCLGSSQLIVEGVLQADNEVALLEGIESSDPGWYFPTNEARIIVIQPLYQIAGLPCSVGDTLSVKYRTEGRSYNPNQPNLITLTGLIVNELDKPVGTCGLFSIRVKNEVQLQAGSWFILSDAQATEFKEYFSQWKVDSKQPLEKWKEKYPALFQGQ